MIRMLQNQNMLLLVYGLLITSLFFDAMKIAGIASASRIVSVIFMLACICAAKRAVIIDAFRSMSLVGLLLVYLLARSALVGFDIHDPYFYALFTNLALACVVVIGLMTINQPTAFAGATFGIMVTFSIGSIFGLGIERDLQDFRLTFLGLNSNEFASLLMTGVITGLYYADSVLSKFQRLSWQYFAGLVLIMSVIFSTGTRFAILGVVLSTIIYATRVFFRHLRPKLALAFVASGMFVLLIEMAKYAFLRFYYKSPLFQGGVFGNLDVWGRSSFLERFDLVNTGVNHNLSSLGGRMELWSISIKAFFSSPYIGLGYEGLKAFSLAQNGNILRPHNALLEALAIGGAPVLVFALLMLRWGISKLRASGTNIEMTFLALLPVAIISMMLNVSSLKLFWVHLGISVYLVRLLQKPDPLQSKQ